LGKPTPKEMLTFFRRMRDTVVSEAKFVYLGPGELPRANKKFKTRLKHGDIVGGYKLVSGDTS